MDLIKSGGSEYDEYESILLERDRCRKEAGQIYTAYLKIFGRLIVENYEAKIECIKCKKTIEYYQSCINRGVTVDAKKLKNILTKR